MIRLELYIDGKLHAEGMWKMDNIVSRVKTCANSLRMKHRYSIGNRPWLILQIPDLKTGRPPIPEEQKERIIELYHRHKNIPDVARITGISDNTVRKVVRAA